jgi:hypothetical protein
VKTAPPALVALTTLLVALHGEHHPHPIEQQPTAYIAAPTVAANATALTVTTSGNYAGEKRGASARYRLPLWSTHT